jgi:hypothetical protein
MKLAYLERAVQRGKDENSRLLQKMQRVESENEKLRL